MSDTATGTLNFFLCYKFLNFHSSISGYNYFISCAIVRLGYTSTSQPFDQLEKLIGAVNSSLMQLVGSTRPAEDWTLLLWSSTGDGSISTLSKR